MLVLDEIHGEYINISVTATHLESIQVQLAKGPGSGEMQIAIRKLQEVRYWLLEADDKIRANKENTTHEL